MQSSSFLYNDHWDYFIKERNEAVAKISDPTNNLIIRLDKLINDFQQQNSEWTSRKEFEKHVVPWSESNRDNCELCKIRFTITRRRHHCRLCGAQLCGSCSQFLSIKSAQRLTGLDSSLVSSFLLAITNGDANHSGNASMFGNLSLSLDKPMGGHGFAVDRTLQNLGNSFAMMKNKLGSVVSRSISGDGVHAGETNAVDGTAAYSLRICSKCKKLLDRRERAMELRWENANDSLVDAYQKLCNLLSQISHLASSYKNMAESLNNGETLYSLTSATSVRLKLKDLQEEIIRLSNLIEDWGSSRGDAPATETAPVLLPSCRQLQLQKNIKLLALHTLHDVVNVGPDLPSVQQYEQKKRDNQQRMMRRRRVGAESAAGSCEQLDENSSSFINKTATILTRKKMAARDRPSSSSFSEFLFGDESSSSECGGGGGGAHFADPFMRRNGRPGGGGEREERPMRQSSSFTGGGRSSCEESWMPFGNPITDKKQNPFLEGLEELHPIQEQYLISKSFLEQATLAGRLDEVKILERNLRELEHELDILHLHKPNEL